METDPPTDNSTACFFSADTVADELRSSLEQIGGGFIALDAAWRYVYANSAAETMIGLPCSELIGRSHWELFPLTLGTPLEEEYRRCIAGEVRDFEYFYEPTGRWYHNRCFPRPTGGISVYHFDVTDQKLLREKLLIAQASIEAAGDGIHWVTADGRILEANPAMCRLLGYTQEELLRMTIMEIDPQLTREQLQLIEREIYQHGRLMMERQHRTSDGRLIPVEVSINAVAVDGKRMACAIVRDISERKRLTDLLKHEQQWFRAIADYTYDWETWVGPGGTTLWSNPAVFSLTGYTAEEYLSLPGAPMCLVLPEDQDRLARVYTEVRRGGQVNDVSFRILHRDGSVRWAAVSCQPIYDDSGVSLGYRASIRDIAERKRYEQELERARDAANAGSRAKSEFLANMSHEIRTPLNSMMMGIQLLQLSGLDAEQLESVDIINTSATNLLSLINDILDLSKVESGRIELEQLIFDFRASIDSICKTQISRIYKKGLKLTVDIQDDIPKYLKGDQVRLKQIMLNLLSNAVKFTDSGGITLSAGLLERRFDTALLRITVSDTGIGIPPEALDRIFEPFTQADTSTTRKFGGTGLGLTISKRLTELMDGRIRVESTQGSGSCFILEIPFAIEQVQEKEKTSDQPFSWTGTPLKILIADDEQNNRQLLARFLGRSGHIVHEAGSGREAVEQWRNEDFDLILMDIRMPGMDGSEAARIIRQREAERGDGVHVPIVALTAHAILEEREEIMRHGFDGYVAKPIRFNQLFAEVERCLHRGES